MSARIRHHIRSNVIGYMALFVALSGTAYATHPGGANTISSGDIIDNVVRSEDIRDGNVTSADLRTDSVISGKIAAGAVQSSDVLDETLTGTDVDDGSLGTAEIDEDSLFNDDSLDARDVSDKSTLGTAEVDEASLFNDNSLDAADISNGSTLGTSEINEAGLSQVPSAAQASEASTLRFNNVTDISVFNFNNGSSGSGFANIGDLNLAVVCQAGTGDLTLEASTDLDNASLAVSDDDAYFDIEDFDTGTDVDILGPLGGDSDEVINLVYVNGSGGGVHDVVTAQFHVLDDAPDGTQSECLVAGHAFESKRT